MFIHIAPEVALQAFQLSCCTPLSPWQPSVAPSKPSFSNNGALQMCLGLNWKRTRQVCSVIKGDAPFSGRGSEEFCPFLTSSGETRTTGVSVGSQFSLQPHKCSHRSPSHRGFIWNPSCGSFWQQWWNRRANVARVLLEELVSYPVDQDRIPSAVRAVSGPVP